MAISEGKKKKIKYMKARHCCLQLQEQPVTTRLMNELSACHTRGWFFFE